jgi:uncharacterized protein (TIGR03083 family)
MAELAEVYELTRKELANFVSSLPEEDLQRPVPATPTWSIHDVIAHMAGVFERIGAGDFPREFFDALGSEQGISLINEWTERQVSARRDRPMQDILDEWETATSAVMPMIRGDVPWPQEVVPYAAYVLMTDLAVHQQDIYGAMGVVKDRDEAPIAIGYSTYVAGVDIRLQSEEGPSLRFINEHKEKVVGGGEPVATVRGERYELFRALSGRRSPDQIREYEWDGDPEPFITYFYPYGVRNEALVE